MIFVKLTGYYLLEMTEVSCDTLKLKSATLRTIYSTEQLCSDLQLVTAAWTASGSAGICNTWLTLVTITIPTTKQPFHKSTFT